jgi:branched-chain amino acid transport system permease protein
MPGAGGDPEITTGRTAARGRRGERLARPVALAAALVLAALVPQVTKRQDLLNLLFLIFLYVTLAQSWNVLAGFAGQTSLGHAAFFGIGALVTRSLWVGGWPFAAAFPLGGLAAAAFALLIGVPTFRLRGAYFAIGTLGVAEVLRITVGNVRPLITTLPIRLIAGYDLAARYYLALGLALATVLAASLLLRSRLSLGILAVREDEDAAQATGVRALRHKLAALVLSTFFAGLAGGVFAFHQVSYYPAAPFSPVWTFDALLITFVGGLGTLVGPIVGAVFYIVVREQLAANLVRWHQVVFGALFILVVLALPGGLVDLWARLRKVRLRGGPPSAAGPG